MTNEQLYGILGTQLVTALMVALSILVNNKRLDDLRALIQSEVQGLRTEMRAEIKRLDERMKRIEEKIDLHLTIVLEKIEEIERR